MKAERIINEQPLAPIAPVVPEFGKGKGAKEARDEYLAACAAHERAVKQHAVDRKLYKEKVVKSMKDAPASEWLGLIRDFHEMRTHKANSATDTMVQAWIKSFQGGFEKAFPGKKIVGKKSGVKVTHYVVEDATSSITQKIVSELVSLHARFPMLFVADFNPENAIKVVENEEQWARKQAIVASELRTLRAQESTLVREYQEIIEQVATFERYAQTLPDVLAAEVAQFNRNIGWIKEEIQERTGIAINA